MKMFYIVLVVFLSVFTNSFSQKSLNDYSYVIVPEQFEFLDQRDKYQLNSILNFLFNKHGFNSFLSADMPDAKRCDGLYADLERGKAFLKTKFSILLRDCDGNEVYRTPQGVSKLKEFKKAYQDAVRKAFKNIEMLNVDQKDIVYFDGTTVSTVEEENKGIKKVEPDQDIIVEKIEDSEKPDLPKSRFSSYSRDGKKYLLRKTDSGYSLYEETVTTNDGLLLVGTLELLEGGKIFFVDPSEKIFKAKFDKDLNLLVQKKNGEEVYTASN